MVGRLTRRWAIWGLVALVAGAVPSRAAEEAASLQDLVRAALATDEGVARAESDLRKAQAGVRLAKSALLPRLDLNATYTRFQNELAWEIASGQSFVIRPLADWNWSADLEQTLFSGLRDWRARDLASVEAEAARLHRVTARLDLALEVAQAFYDTLGATENLQVRRAALDEAEAQLTVARRRFEVGEVAQADVLRWQARVAADRRSLVEAEGIRRLARRRLARLCGVDPAPSLQPLTGVPVPRDTPRELMAAALEQRPVLRSLHRRLRAAGLRVKIEKGNRLPELRAHAQYYRQKSTFPSPDWLSVALSLRVRVFDGGLTAARVARAREDRRQAELTIREATKAVMDQVDSALVGLETAEASLAAAEESRKAAREAHRRTERAYRAGEATATDLLAASTALTEAETAVVVARWQRELQAIALRRAVGQEPIPGLILSGEPPAAAAPSPGATETQ